MEASLMPCAPRVPGVFRSGSAPASAGHRALTAGRRLLAALLLLPVLAAAQSTFDGTWDVTFSTKDTETRQAVVKIAGTEGTWMTMARPGKDRSDPCVSRDYPLTVTATDAKHLAFEVAFSKVMSGCKDRSLSGQLDDSGAIDGTLDNGKPARMVRRPAG